MTQIKERIKKTTRVKQLATVSNINVSEEKQVGNITLEELKNNPTLTLSSSDNVLIPENADFDDVIDIIGRKVTTELVKQVHLPQQAVPKDQFNMDKSIKEKISTLVILSKYKKQKKEEARIEALENANAEKEVVGISDEQAFASLRIEDDDNFGDPINLGAEPEE